MAHLIIINIMTIIQTVSVINLCDFVPMMSQLNNHMTANMAVLRVTSLLLLVCIVTGGPTCRYKHETKTYSQPVRMNNCTSVKRHGTFVSYCLSTVGSFFTRGKYSV